MRTIGTARTHAWLAAIGIAACAVAFRLDAVRVPFAFDDYGHIAMLEGAFPVHRAPFDLFRYVSDAPSEHRTLLATGALPWWSDRDVRFAMLRPLSSLLAAFDHAVAPRNALFAHVHSALWLVAALLALHWMFRAWLGAAAGVVALLLYAGSASITTPIAWWADRGSLVSLTFGALACAFYRERPTRPWRIAAAFGAALAGGEYAISAYAYVASAEMAGDALEPRDRRRRIAGAVGPLVGYVAAHVLGGYGVRGSTIYIDPIADPARFVTTAPARLLALATDLFASIPAEQAVFAPRTTTWVIASALVFVIASAVALRRADVRAATEFRTMLVGGLLALLPVAGTMPHGRLLVFANIGTAGAAAVLIVEAARAMHRRTSSAWAVTPLALIALVTWLHALPRTPREAADAALHAPALQRGLQHVVSDRSLAGLHMVLLSALDPQTLLYPPDAWRLAGLPLPRAFWVLSMAPAAHVLRRTAASVLDLTAVRQQILASPGELLFRAEIAPPPNGTEFAVDGMHVTTLDAGLAGPRRIRVRFDRDLDDPSMALFITRADGIYALPMPAVGGVRVIAPPEIAMRFH